MKRLFLLFFLLFFSFESIAQYTEIINSRRPGFSESPYSVGTNVYQFETGLFYRTSDDNSYFSNPNRFGGELFFRYGKFREKLEFNARIAYQNDEVQAPLVSNYNIHGISELTLGAKYMLFQQEFTDRTKEVRSWKRRTAFDKKRLIPSVGLYVGVNTNFLGKDYKSDEGMTLKTAVLLQNDFSDRLVLVTNLIVDNLMGETNEYSYIATMTYAINFKWSYFIENQGFFKDQFSPRYHFGTGIAYLFSNDLQLDASVRTNFFDDYSFIYSSLGVAWRIDRHQDQVFYTNPASTNKSKPKKRKKGGFFSRIFKKKN